MNRYKVFTKLNIPWFYRPDLLMQMLDMLYCFYGLNGDSLDL